MSTPSPAPDNSHPGIELRIRARMPSGELADMVQADSDHLHWVAKFGADDPLCTGWTEVFPGRGWAFSGGAGVTGANGDDGRGLIVEIRPVRLTEPPDDEDHADDEDHVDGEPWTFTGTASYLRGLAFLELMYRLCLPPRAGKTKKTGVRQIRRTNRAHPNQKR